MNVIKYDEENGRFVVTDGQTGDTLPLDAFIERHLRRLAVRRRLAKHLTGEQLAEQLFAVEN